MFLLWLRQLPHCGDQTPASVPPATKGRSSPTNPPVFFPLVPLSYQVLRGSIYSFPLVRSSCLLSAGVLHALLCLKVYSWCIHGERCTPRPPTLPPSWISVYDIEPTPHSKSGLLWVVVKFLLLGWDKKQWISCSSHLNILLSWSFFLTLCVDICALD